MYRITTLRFILFLLLLSLAGKAKSSTYPPRFPPKSDTLKADTLNRTDSAGRQGYWIIKGNSRPNSCYQTEGIVEKGNYSNNKKTGTWTEYHCTGSIKAIITYDKGKPSGPANIYYENGKIKEEGTWENNRWVGNYTFYEEDGRVKEYTFDKKGRREGIPTANYEDFQHGTILKEGTWACDSATIVFKNISGSPLKYVHAVIRGKEVGFFDLKAGCESTPFKVCITGRDLFRFSVFRTNLEDKDTIAPMDYEDQVSKEKLSKGSYVYTIGYDKEEQLVIRLVKLK